MMIKDIHCSSRPSVLTSILPVTSICFLPRTGLFLAGRGSHLCLYDQARSGHVWARKVFTTNTVHGITVRQIGSVAYVALVWGGRSLCAIRITHESKISGITSTSESLTVGPTVQCSDRVLDCDFRPHDENSSPTVLEAVAITAHNALVRLIIQDESRQDGPAIEQGTLCHATKCLLYSADVRWTVHGSIYIAAGTAFGTVIVWSHDPDNAADIIQRTRNISGFMAHSDGSVFGVCLLSVELAIGSGQNKLRVVTCSDDRTMKLWNVLFAEDDTSCQGSQLDRRLVGLTEIKPLGTSVLLSAMVSPRNAKSPVGHMSRVWHTQALDLPLNPPKLISIGEDATCQVWIVSKSKTSSDAVASDAFNHLATFNNHAGKNVWSVASSSNESGTATIVTGGADGRLVKQVLDLEKRAGIQRHERHVDEPARRVLKSYAFIGRNLVLAAAANGEVLISDLQQDDSRASISWRQIGHLGHLENYSITVGIPSLQLGFIAGSNGDVVGFVDDRLLACPSASVGDAKVGALFAQTYQQATSNSSGRFALVVACLRLPLAILCLLNASTRQRDDVPTWACHEGAQRCQLILESGFVITSMFFATATSSVLLGFRDGHIAAYELSDRNLSAGEPAQSISKFRAHEDAITCMLWQNNHLICTSRDGTYSIHRVSLNGDDRELLHRLTLPFGPNIEGILLDSASKPCFYGFHGEDFVVYDEAQQREVARIQCGGAHRVWAFDASADMREMTLAWNRASTFHVASIRDMTYECIQSGGHGREIKAAAISPVPCTMSGQLMHLIATGAEDTDIRIFALPIAPVEAGMDTPRCVRILKKHDTGVQQMRWSADGRYLFSCGGRQEFFVWRIQEAVFVEVGVVCESGMPIVTELSDMRLMDFDVHDERAGREDPEVIFLITMAFSNSSLRRYRYTRSRGVSRWDLLSSTTGGDHCLTVARHLQVLCDEAGEEPPWILTSGTNGSHSLWRSAASALILNCETRLHQNTIKDLLAVPLASSVTRSFALVTVGDDNALGVTRLDLSDKALEPSTGSGNGLQSIFGAKASALIIPRAHAASATSIALLSTHSNEEKNSTILRIVTAANDQRLKIWEISIDATLSGVQGVKVKQLHNLASDVADVSSVSILPDLEHPLGGPATILVCGVGMEVWKIPVSTSDAGCVV